MKALAFDLGASSGKTFIGKFDGKRLKVNEMYRFSNDPVWVGRHLHWDLLRLFYEIKQGLLKAKQQGELKSLAIDSWAVDFGLIDKNGELLGNPYHYRDPQTNGIMEEVFLEIPKREIFSRTGIQFMPINTLYHLYAMKKAGSPLLEKAKHLLMMPDLFRYFLTGEKKGEWTNASTTQLFHPHQKEWDRSLLDRLNLPSGIFPEVVEPGTAIGTLHSSVYKELGLPAIPVVTTAEHDTASAVAAIPSDREDFAYLSCGTWSLLGTEIPEPVIHEKALKWNFTNEGGVNQTFRLLRNIMGLWLVQECQRVWAKEGEKLNHEEIIQLAAVAEPFQMFIDPDHSMFLNPSHMPAQIQEYCRATGQSIPETKAEILRCILESLALKYRLVLERTEQLACKTFPGLHMVGGGIRNEMLCAFTASALNRPVWAGPVEATAIGNLLIQYVTLGEIKSVWEGRSVIRNSFPVKTYEPEEPNCWNEAYRTFRLIIDAE